MCDKTNIDIYHLNAKYAVVENLSACKINGIKVSKDFLKKSNNCVNIQIIDNPTQTINSKYNYILVLQSYLNSSLYLPNYSYDYIISIKNEMNNSLIIYANFTNGSSFSILSNSSAKFIYSYSNNVWIVFN